MAGTKGIASASGADRKNGGFSDGKSLEERRREWTDESKADLLFKKKPQSTPAILDEKGVIKNFVFDAEKIRDLRTRAVLEFINRAADNV